MGTAVTVHDACEREIERIGMSDPAEKAALRRTIAKLEALGAALGHPHTSAVRGSASGLRELRPRAGRSRWRLIYQPAAIPTVLALAPEAQSDPRGFQRAVAIAEQRRRSLEEHHAQ